MKFEYRATLVNRVTRTIKNIVDTIDASTWVEYVRERPKEYGNLAAILDEILPSLKDPNAGCSAAVEFVVHLEEKLDKMNANIKFEFVMFCWHQFKTGQIPAETWAGALGYGWQSGQRGMLGGVKLSQNTVLDMFRSAPIEKLYWVSSGKDDWHQYFSALPDEMQIYRGTSSGSSLAERGFSWTTDSLEAWKFAALNTHSRKELPIMISAKISKDAVLAAFEFESEIVIDPQKPKREIKQTFLNSSKLRQFYKQYKIGENGQIAGVGNINDI